MHEPALGLIEFKSIAKGIFATDAIAKKAPVKILSTNPICPGKYLAMFCGEVADVDESMKAGLAAGGDMVINCLFLPHLHETVIPALSGATKINHFGSLCIIETFSVASCVAAADKAAKTVPIKLIEIRLANGLGGKAFFVMTGDLADIEAAAASIKELNKEEGMLAGCEIIASPHPDLIDKGVYW